MPREFDIIIAGAGIGGILAACLFGTAGHSVALVDPAPAPSGPKGDRIDLRSTAFLQPSLRILELAGVWQHLSPVATSLDVMEIMDIGGDGQTRSSRAFRASDISELPFGWNILNRDIRAVLLERMEKLENVTAFWDKNVTGYLSRSDRGQVRLSDGINLQAQLVLAADGRNSSLRKAVGIGAHTTRFGQKALSFAVTHPIPHQNVSTEIHLKGGPFTLVPLPNHEDRPSSAVVWMEDASDADRLLSLDRAAFEAAIFERSAGHLGELRLITDRQGWPVISRLADRFIAERLALIGEAAHVVPPIGAQGLNMTLADLTSLYDLSRKLPLGSSEMLQEYSKARRIDAVLRVTGITSLNKISQSKNPFLSSLRSLGIEALHDAKPVRKGLMRLGLGTSIL